MELDAHLIGSSLRARREELRLTLAQAEAQTRIRARYLAALEEERFDDLPADAYARGFLRSYASFLGLDGSAYLAAYRTRRRAAEPAIAPVPVGRRDPQRRWLLAAAAAMAILLALGLGAWQLDGRGAARPDADAAATDAVLFPQRALLPAPLVLRAAGGDCWLEVRIGGPRGRLAWSGTLRDGRTLRLGLSKALFVRAGAPDNLRATIGAQPQRIRTGAWGFVATRGGIAPRD